MTKDKMLYVAGSKTAFRCECGCNVFRKVEDKHPATYECNSCDARYTDWSGVNDDEDNP